MEKTVFDDLIVKALDKERAGQGLFELVQDFHAMDPIRGNIVVPAGYVTDFASIPRIAMWLLPISGKCSKPAVLHDYICARGVTEDTKEQRRWSTGIFNRALKSEGVWFWRRWLMISFVAAFKFPDLYL